MIDRAGAARAIAELYRMMAQVTTGNRRADCERTSEWWELRALELESEQQEAED
jgi:hypothetical protein